MPRLCRRRCARRRPPHAQRASADGRYSHTQATPYPLGSRRLIRGAHTKICRSVYIERMPSKGDLTKARLAASMLELIQTNGYSGTGLNAVIDHAGAPRGSVYFHFPEGKEALGAAAVDLARAQFETLIAEVAATAGGPAAAARSTIEALASIVVESDFQLGCPVSVVTLEMGANSDRLRQACATAFESWITPVARLLENGGPGADAARSLASVSV